MQSDHERLASLARLYAAEIERNGQGRRSATGARRIARGVVRARQWLVRKVREIARDHWDVGVFDLLFGSVKAFGIYPALFFAGLSLSIRCFSNRSIAPLP